jgi:hypothetical protein
VQGSGETGRVVDPVATLPPPPINTPLGYPADAYQRAAAIEAERAATGIATPTQSTQPSYPNINEIDPRTGMPEGSSADYWATQKEVNAPAYGMDIYSIYSAEQSIRTLWQGVVDIPTLTHLR